MRSKNAFMKKVLAVALTSCVTIGGLGIASPNLMNSTVYATEESSAVTVEENSMSNEYIKLVTADNGRFVLGTTGGDLSRDTDNDKKLLYGFPDDVGTSYTTIRIDGASYIYGKNGLEISPTFNAIEKSCVSTQIINNLEITQTLSFVNNVSTDKEDVMEIKYVVKNNDSVSHNVGTRIMLDTMLGSNDHAPFRVQGTGSVTTETEFTGENIPQYWQAFDSLTEPTVVSQGTFIRGEDLKPDKVQFAHWGNLLGGGGVAEASWDYIVTDGRNNGDSAVTITWNETELVSGASRTYKTYYGLSQLTQDLLPPLAISVYGDNSVTATAFDFRKRETVYLPLAITSYLENIGEAEADNVYIRIDLPESMSLAEGSQKAYKYDVLNISDIQQVGWNINIPGNIPIGTHLIKIVCGADGIEEKTIQKYITVPERDMFEADNRILWGEKNIFGSWTGLDNLGFINQSSDFIGMFQENKYRISDEYFNILTNDLAPTVVQNIADYRDSEWGGSCYGMSSVVSLIKSGYLTPERYTSNAEVAHDLKKPKDSDSVTNIINFFHLSQKMPDIVDLYDNFAQTSNESDWLQQLVFEAQKVKQGGMPVTVGFSWCHKVTDKKYSTFTFNDRRNLLSEDNQWTDGNGAFFLFSEDELNTLTDGGLLGDDTIDFGYDGSSANYSIKYKENGNKIILKNDEHELTLYRYKSSGHQIVAYDVDIGSFEAENGQAYKYRISVCDPNKSTYTYLYISEDYNNWYYHEMSTVSGGSNNVIKYSDNREVKWMGAILSDIGTLNIRNPETDADYVVLKNYNRRFIQDHTNSSVNISTTNNSVSINGLSTIGNDDYNVITLPGISADGKDNDGERIIFIPENLPTDEPITLKPLSGSGIINSSVNLTNYLFVVKADSGNKAIADPTGKISLQSNNDHYTLGVTFNEGCSLPWYTVRTSGQNANSSSLQVVSDGIILTSDNLKDVETTANNRNNEVSLNFSTDKDSVKFMAVDNDTLGAYIDNDGDGVYETLISDSNGGSDKPSDDPSDDPSDEPSDDPSDESSNEPSDDPSDKPSNQPSDEPSNDPSGEPSSSPTVNPNNNSPATGDSNPGIFMVVLFVVSSSAMVFCFRYRKRKIK